MDDVQTLRAALTGDDPPQDVVDHSRHRLQQRMRGGRSSREPTGWRAWGVGLAVAAAAAAVAFSTLPGAPPGGPPAASGNGSSVERPPVVSGPEILLAAATAAQRSPDGSGAYWHVAVTYPDERTDEYWTSPDGRTWFAGQKTDGRAILIDTHRPKPFSLVAVDLTLDQLRALPTDPAALRAWIAEAVEHSDARTSAGPLTAADRERATFESLIALVSTVPAPPGVRAAAFRAIASYPDVKTIGAVPGGQGLMLPGGRRLVVDPSTGRVNGTSVFVSMEGAVYSVPDPAGARIDAGWTDGLPE
ncbi:MAG: CU044_5270 family protein [Saccharothrix sp.]|nr:CU044_5270 family protein [Saccharothrix sp.]